MEPIATNKPKANGKALLPILVFLVLYLGIGIFFEYIHPIDGQMVDHRHGTGPETNLR